MPNDSYRPDQRAARDAGLAARHETRVERAIRRQVAEEAADAIADRQRYSVDELTGPLSSSLDRIARIVREIGSKEHSNQATEETK